MKIIVSTILFSTLISCSEPYRIVELYIQRIPDSQNAIYEYYCSSKLNDSEFGGYAILDSTENVVVSKLNKLPITLFSKLPDRNRVEIIHLVWPKDKSKNTHDPIQKYSLNVNGIECKIIEYEETYGGSTSECFLSRYRFDFFKESEDSLYLFGISKIWRDNPDLPEKISFQKGNIKIIEDGKNQVIRLKIEELIMINSSGCIKTYYFEPKAAIKVTDFSDFGIFKLVHSKNYKGG